MRFSQLWIILRQSAVITLVFMTVIILNSGITSASHHPQPQRNSSKDQNFLTDYLSLVLNKSRELEENIYSDIINNLRTLVKVPVSLNENKQTKKVECSANEYSKSKNIVKTEGDNKTLNHSRAPVFDVFLYGEQEKNIPLRNYISGTPGGFLKNSFLLGYSGNPFGSQKLIEMPEVVRNERIIIDPRKKRSVLHLYNMVLCSTGCNPTSYKGYGCYCGFLGSGFVVDGIDNCCKMHDLCYNNAGCPMFLEYFIPYLWKCYHRQPLCAIDYQYYGSPASCSQRLCECDRQLALCLTRYPCPTTKALCTSSPWRLLQNILML